jgi:UDP-glucose 4-epimerase
MRILITGGSGFIGSHCADVLVDRGEEVTIFDHRLPRHEFRSTYVAGDLRDRSAVEVAARGQDFIIHAAGTLGTDIYESATTNILGGLHVLEAAHRNGSNLIVLSKPNVWLNPYSITKDSIEKFSLMYVNEFDTSLTIVKAFNVYGPRQEHMAVKKAIPTWIVHALRNEPIVIFGSGTSTMDLIYARDVTDALTRIIDNFEKCRIRKIPRAAEDIWSNFTGYNRQIIELGSGNEITVNDAVQELQDILDIPLRVTHVAMRAGETENTRLRADITRLSQLTGFRPKVGLREGLRETIAYYKEHQTSADRA